MCAAAEGGGAPAALPNVLLVSLDTLRADHLASYGYRRDTAPTLTRLAAEGAQFDRSYAQAPSTVPTHASLFTGRLPAQHGAYGYRQPLRAEELALAEHLRAHGYRTFAAASSLRFAPNSGFAQGFDHYAVFEDVERNQRSRRVVDAALEQTGAADQRPWFGFLHFFDVHAPYAPPESFVRRWHPARGAFPPSASMRFLKEHADPASAVPPEVLAYLIDLYDAGISHLDTHLTRLFRELRPRNGRPCLVVATADHGEAFKEHGGFLHWGHHWEEVVRVPLLYVWPGRIGAGLRIAQTAQSVDLFPTLVELLGLAQPPGLAGRSLAGALLGAPPDAPLPPRGRLHDVVVMQQEPGLWAVSAILDGARYKLIREDAPERYRLFRLDVDPGERRDLLPGAEPLRDALAALVAAPGEPAAASPPDPDAVRRLRELGYLEETDALAPRAR